MVIAISTRLLLNDESNFYTDFTKEIFSRITTAHKEHTFIFIFDKPYEPAFLFSENIIPVVMGPSAKNRVNLYIWYNIKIPYVLKKYKAEVFVSPDGFCSAGTKIPQCILLDNLDFLTQKSKLKKNPILFYKKFEPKFIKKAAIITTLSQFIKDDIIKNYKTEARKIKVVYSGIREDFSAVSTEEREIIKEKYAGGNEYFIYTGEIGRDKNLMNLLKAFSAFKKRQKSKMQLLIAGIPWQKYEELFKMIRLFKFKEEVKILENLPFNEFIKITASAYAMVYPSISESFATQPLQAMKSGTPVMTSSNTAMEEICGEAALYADPKNFKAIAQQMMLLFKDENLRSSLIQKGKLQAAKYSWDKTAGLFWDAIEKAMPQ